MMKNAVAQSVIAANAAGNATEGYLDAVTSADSSITTGIGGLIATFVQGVTSAETSTVSTITNVASIAARNDKTFVDGSPQAREAYVIGTRDDARLELDPTLATIQQTLAIQNATLLAGELRSLTDSHSGTVSDGQHVFRSRYGSPAARLDAIEFWTALTDEARKRTT